MFLPLKGKETGDWVETAPRFICLSVLRHSRIFDRRNLKLAAETTKMKWTNLKRSFGRDGPQPIEVSRQEKGWTAPKANVLGTQPKFPLRFVAARKKERK